MNHSFFIHLSTRMKDENALSDITWAFAQSHDVFRTYFIKFFFSDFGDDEKILEFRREYSRNDSRPDLYIRTNKTEYIVENKIYDRDIKFDKYASSFKNIAYIANYKIPTPVNQICIPKTWEQLYDYFSEINEKRQDNEIEHFLIYIKQVCGIIKKEKRRMNLLNISSLPLLNKNVSEVLFSDPRFTTKKTVFKGAIDKYGFYYDLVKKENNEEKICIWIGIYFYREGASIAMEIEGKSNSILDQKNDLEQLDNGEFYSADSEKNWYFKLKQEKFNDFNSCKTIEEQQKTLRDFISEVLFTCDFIN